MDLSKKIEGKRGEEIASNFLQKNGYKIIERNFSKRYGEIDIIALDLGSINNKKEQTLVFVEVKTRKSQEFGSPLEAVTPFKLRSLIKTAQYYMLTHKNLPQNIRMDAIAVELSENDALINIEHAKNITG